MNKYNSSCLLASVHDCVLHEQLLNVKGAFQSTDPVCKICSIVYLSPVMATLPNGFALACIKCLPGLIGLHACLSANYLLVLLAFGVARQ